MKKVSQTYRLPEDDVLFLLGEVENNGGKRNTSMAEQVHICIVQRKISLLPPEERARLLANVDDAEAVDDGTGKQEEMFDDKTC